MSLDWSLSFSTICSILALSTIALYCNTLGAWFAFDDNFAVINNGDVSDPNTTWRGLLYHDFWGQDIKSNQSHKSYRPVTVASFRFLRYLGSDILPVLGWKKGKPANVGQDDARGLDPFPFHLANVLVHALVTCIVYRLALKLSLMREGGEASLPPEADVPDPGQQLGALTDGESAVPYVAMQGAPVQPLAKLGKSVQRRRSPGSSDPTPEGEGAPGEDSKGQEYGGRGRGHGRGSKGGQGPWLFSLEARHAVEAGLAAAIFAVHPVHVEAVAGVVGHAELLGAAFSLLALLVYCSADGSCVAGNEERGKGQEAGLHWLPHWVLVGAAILLAFAAALAKEIGITILGAMAVVEVYLGGAGARRPSSGPSGSAGSRWGPSRARQLARLALLGASLVMYVRLRSRIAGDQLVRIYRKVENPIAFAEPLAANLTTGYLHARYALLLMFPIHLSADWSYPCIPLVDSWSDSRNGASLALYLALLVATWAAKPWKAPLALLGLHRGDSAARTTQVSGWWMVVIWGLMVGPFLPASNLFFYVGTFIGERLLYMPSVGYSLLLSYGMCRLAGLWGSGAQSPGDRQGGRTGSPQRLDRRRRCNSGHEGWWGQWGRYSVVLSLALSVLAAYAYRTWLRNWDWADEESLFLAAQQVCWKSAKVQLNSGVLMRRHGKWEEALEHFRLARDLEPSYCEPTYWIGITLLQQRTHLNLALQELEEAIGCKYVMLEALNALQAVYEALLESRPGDASTLRAWAAILLRPEVMRPEEGCDLLEQAALASLSRSSSQELSDTIKPCLEALERNPAKWERVRGCVRARMAILPVLQKHDPASTEVKKAVYAYLAESGRLCRLQHSMSWVQKANHQPHRASQAHMHLIHWVLPSLLSPCLYRSHIPF
eukprot:jgi/Botrbrau1/19857/Bobra.0124s0090.2